MAEIRQAKVLRPLDPRLSGGLFLVQSHLFPVKNYNEETEEVFGSYLDRLFVHDRDRLSRMFNQRFGDDSFDSVHHFCERGDAAEVFGFVLETLSRGPKLPWTGFRVTYIPCTPLVIFFELFVKHEGSETEVASERIPNWDADDWGIVF